MSTEIKANDLRTYAIQNRTEVACRVRTANQVCVVHPNGVVKIPGISGHPPYNIDDVIARADEFTLTGKDREARSVSREEMGELLKPPTPARTAAKPE